MDTHIRQEVHIEVENRQWTSPFFIELELVMEQLGLLEAGPFKRMYVYMYVCTSPFFIELELVMEQLGLLEAGRLKACVLYIRQPPVRRRHYISYYILLYYILYIRQPPVRRRHYISYYYIIYYI
jgi:hypothetical protein